MKLTTKENRLSRLILLTLIISLLLSSCNLPKKIATNTPTDLLEKIDQPKSTELPKVEEFVKLDQPPMLLESTPIPGSSIGLNEPILLTFNQAMDQTSVEDAFSGDPALSGQFEWKNDSTVAFIPDQAYPVNAHVELTILETARAKNGKNLLKPVNLKFQVSQYLQLTNTIPYNEGEEIDPSSAIVAAFNQPVISLGQEETPVAFTLQPEVQGHGEWLNTSTYIFYPESGMFGGTKYIATLNDSLSSVGGAPLDPEHYRTWSFSTAKPAIVETSPVEGLLSLNGPIQIDFNVRMDTMATESAFALTNPEGIEVSGNFSWNDAITQLTFTPSSLLERGIVYTLTIDKGAASFGGIKIEQIYTQSFTTYPEFEATINPNADFQAYYAGYGVFSILTTSPVDSINIHKHIHVFPEISNLYVYPASSGTGLTISGYFEPNVTYSVEISKDLKDLWGTTLTEDFSFSIKTPSANPSFFIGTQPYSYSYRVAFSPVGESKIFGHATNVSYVNTSIARVSLEDFLWFMEPDNYEAKKTYSPSNQQYDTQYFTISPDKNETVSIPLTYNNQQLSAGLYFVKIDAPEVNIDYSPKSTSFMLAVSNYNTLIKISQEQVFVWVVSIDDHTPLRHETVQIISENGDLITSGLTDDEGFFKADIQSLKSLYEPYYAIVGDLEVPETFSLASTTWENDFLYYDLGLNVNLSSRSIMVYTYTDRPIYRPGQKVNFKSIIRSVSNSIYFPAELESLTVEAYASNDYGTSFPVYSAELSLSEYGSISGSFVIPQQAAPGGYYLAIKDGKEILTTYYIDVANYRKPEIELDVTLSKEDVIQGEGLLAEIQADYYFGIPAANLEVIWNLYRRDSYFDLPGFLVGDLDIRWMQPAFIYKYFSTSGDLVTSGSGKTNQDGSLTISINPEMFEQYQNPLYEHLILEASITDQSGFVVSQRAQADLHPETYYIGIHPDQYFSREKEEMTFEVLTTDWNGEPTGDKALDATFSKVTWEINGYDAMFMTPNYVIKEEVFSNTSFLTDEKGEARLSFTPPEPGTYMLTIQGGNAVTKSMTWVGGAAAATWPNLSNNKIKLVPDASNYSPGQTANIFIPNPFGDTATALITLERGKVMFNEVVEVDGAGISFPVNLGEEEMPNVYFGVILLGKNERGQPDYYQGMVNLAIDPISQLLSVQVTLDPPLAVPGENIRLTLEVKDQAGNPVQGEFSIALIDKSILALKDQYELPIKDAFYRIQPISVVSSFSISAFANQNDIEPQSPGLGGGGGEGGQAEAVVREEFKDTAYWQGQILTDTNGKAEIMVSLPDNLTTWHILIRGITQDSKVGEATAEVVTQKKLMILPETPRFLVAGDHVNLLALVYNNTDEDLQVEVILQNSGFKLDDVDKSTQVVSIPARSNTPVSWWGVVENVPSLDLIFSAQSGALKDASRPSWGNLPVKRYITPIRYTTAGVLPDAGTRLEVVSMPTSFTPEGGSLNLIVNTSLGSTILESLEMINANKDTDNVSLMAIMLSNLETYQTLTEADFETEMSQEEMRIMIQFQIFKIISNKNYDGGWIWNAYGNKYSTSDSFITAYLLYGLERALELGFLVNDYTMQTARDFLKANILLPTSNTDAWALNSTIFEIFALKGEINDAKAVINKLYSLRSQVSPAAKAQLALTLWKLDPGDERIKTLLSDLEGSAIRSASGAYWESGSTSWFYPGTSTYTTSFVLTALAELDNPSDLLVDGSRYLVNIRQGEKLWGSAFDDAWVLAALNHTLVKTGDLQSDYDFFAALNNQTVVEGTASGIENPDPISVSIPISNLLSEWPNGLAITRDDGSGSLYYRTDLVLYRDAASAPAINKGIQVERQYYLGDVCPESCQSIQEVTFMGGKIPPIITVELTLTIPNELVQLRVEDFIPAGSEIINPNLKTSQSGQEAYEVNTNDSDYSWWVWLFFDEPQIYDDHILWMADYLPAGTYTLSYKIIPFQAGEFQVMPAHAWQYFFPEVEGSSTGDLFAIRKQ